MTNAPNTPNLATGAAQGAPPSPEAPSALPFSLPPEMSPQQAQARLAELKTDGDWQKRWMSGDKRAASEFDALTTLGAGQKPPAPKVEPENLVRPPAPPSAGFYTFPTRVLDTPEATNQATEARSLAHEHGLTPLEFTGIAEQQQDDANRFAGMTDEQKLDTVVDELGRIFGEHYDRTFENIERYLGEHPTLKAKINSLGLAYNKRAMMVVGDLANSKYGLR